MNNLHFTYDLRLTQGDDRTITLQFEDEVPAPYIITGHKFLYTAKKAYTSSDTDEFAVLTVEFSAMTIGESESGVSGFDTLLIPLASIDTEDVPPGNYLHEIERDISGAITTIMKGTLVVDPQVTNRPQV